MKQKGCQTTHSQIKKDWKHNKVWWLSHRLIDQITTTSKQKANTPGLGMMAH
jgi:hypothetical protein